MKGEKRSRLTCTNESKWSRIGRPSWEKPCIKAEMSMNVIGQAEERCNQAGSSCQDVCGGACVTEG